MDRLATPIANSTGITIPLASILNIWFISKDRVIENRKELTIRETHHLGLKVVYIIY